MGAGLTPFFRLRIDLFDPAKAIGFGIVRPGDERSAHFRAVPAGHDAKPKRLFRFDVTRREILHGLCNFRVGVQSLIERLEVSDHSKTGNAQLLSESRVKSAKTAATRSR
jgi:hypothetical protein